MKKKDLLIAGELKNKLSRAVHLVDFKVFGSRARGDADKYSDLDVFIEVEKLDKETDDLVHHITWEVGLENSIVICPLVFSRYELEETAIRSSDIVLNINEEGISI